MTNIFETEDIHTTLKDSPLGKRATYVSQYSPELLFPIPRKLKYDEIGVTYPLPFKGCDVWNAYELSWLNHKGKPIVALAEIIYPCDSKNLVESKSLKLYLNSFNNTRFNSLVDVKLTIQKDLSAKSDSEVAVNIYLEQDIINNNITPLTQLAGICIDGLDIQCDNFSVNSDLLSTKSGPMISESLHSHLLKSNCLVTGQPDWGSLEITYTGKPIDHEGLLQYIVSFRNHNEFHEQCVERIFMAIMRKCQPSKLTLNGRYTRRGGLDINPFRSTEANIMSKNIRTFRQ